MTSAEDIQGWLALEHEAVWLYPSSEPGSTPSQAGPVGRTRSTAMCATGCCCVCTR